MVILSCLIAQLAHRETAWHHRGALKAGLSPFEIESVQRAIESIAAECGVDVKSGMPGVHDIVQE
jgi:alkylhydroperoxidase/carboxymuconolactone decarboxylase family protein YurZ